MRKSFAPILPAILLSLIAASVTIAQKAPVTPYADHHQHVFSRTYAKLQSPDFQVVTAADVIALLDKAGIKRAALFSTGFRYGRPGAEPADEYSAVKAENDWTAAQAAQYPKRLIAFCSFNPLKEYALDELARCSRDPNLRGGIKMHFGNSDVQLEVPEHFKKLKQVFQAANKSRMAVVVHMRASLSKQRPYGPEQARLFLELLSFAPDIPVQIAHMASSGPGFVDPAAHSVLASLAEAVANKDRRTRNLWFDVASNAHPNNPPETSELLVKMIRKIGVKRVVYGTDGASGNNLRPRESWTAFRSLALTEQEIKAIARNTAPYFK